MLCELWARLAFLGSFFPRPRVALWTSCTIRNTRERDVDSSSYTCCSSSMLLIEFSPSRARNFRSGSLLCSHRLTAYKWGAVSIQSLQSWNRSYILPWYNVIQWCNPLIPTRRIAFWHISYINNLAAIFPFAIKEWLQYFRGFFFSYFISTGKLKKWISIYLRVNNLLHK